MIPAPQILGGALQLSGLKVTNREYQNYKKRTDLRGITTTKNQLPRTRNYDVSKQLSCQKHFTQCKPQYLEDRPRLMKFKIDNAKFSERSIRHSS